MKTAKTVTNGLALMLAVFILLFLATQFLGYHPSDDALKKDSKLKLFFAGEGKTDGTCVTDLSSRMIEAIDKADFLHK